MKNANEPVTAPKTFYYACAFSERETREKRKAFRPLKAEADQIFTDTITSQDAVRESYELLKTAVLREGDTLVTPSLSCLHPSRGRIAGELQWLCDNHITLRVLDMPSTLADKGSNALVLQTLTEAFRTTVSQDYEKARQRQQYGIAAARARGVRFGRPVKEKGAEFERVKARWDAGEITRKEAMRLLDVSYHTFSRWISETGVGPAAGQGQI